MPAKNKIAKTVRVLALKYKVSVNRGQDGIYEIWKGGEAKMIAQTSGGAARLIRTYFKY